MPSISGSRWDSRGGRAGTTSRLRSARVSASSHSEAADDTTGLKFGTPFAFSFGAGVKYVTGGRVQLRVDVGERLFKQKYPDAYYRTASDNTAVLTDASRSYWTNHGLITVGVSYLFDR